VNLQTFTYDANSNKLTAADYNGAYTMSYDALNRATVTKEPFGVVLTATYDAAGNRTTVQDSLGGTTTFVFDNLHNLTSEQFGGSGQTPLRVDLAYDPRNLVTTITRYSDLAGTTKIGSTLQGYDAIGRLTSQQDRNSSDANIANYTNTYDAASRMTSEQVNGAAPTTYTYDNTNELTNDGTTTYTYDLNGNRTMAGYTTGAGNQLVSQGAWSYSYDLNGNLISKTQSPSVDTWTNIYDHLNRLVGVQDRTNPGGTLLTAVTYVYDVMGNRIEEDTWTSGGGGTTARFAYDGQNAFADLNGSNTLTMRRLYLNGVDQLFARIDSGGSASWYLTDHQGSVRGIVSAAGSSQATVVYDGFGNVASNSNSAATDRYLYTAREYDSATFLQYNRARFYDSIIGRWTAQDPIQFRAGDTNLYRYSQNSPTTFVDPTGLWTTQRFQTSAQTEKWIRVNLDPLKLLEDFRFCQVWQGGAIKTVGEHIGTQTVSLIDLPDRKMAESAFGPFENTLQWKTSNWTAADGYLGTFKVNFDSKDLNEELKELNGVEPTVWLHTNILCLVYAEGNSSVGIGLSFPSGSDVMNLDGFASGPNDFATFVHGSGFFPVVRFIEIEVETPISVATKAINFEAFRYTPMLSFGSLGQKNWQGGMASCSVAMAYNMYLTLRLKTNMMFPPPGPAGAIV
jgi:RHS repeat-associated protein